MNDIGFDVFVASGQGLLISPRSSGASMEIIEVTSGELVIQIGTETVSATEGELIYVPTNMMLRAEAVGEYASLCGVSFSPLLFEDALEHFDGELLTMFYIQSRTSPIRFASDNPISSALHRCMEVAADEFLSKELCYRLVIKANILFMISAILRSYSESRNERDRMIYHNVTRLAPVIDYIAEHFEEKIYVDSLAEIITVSNDYFIKMFKDSIGKTPIDYINGLRINKAMQYLAETDMPMSDISDKIGFCNANYFHKIFKQYTDTSPLAYRKSAK